MVYYKIDIIQVPEHADDVSATAYFYHDKPVSACLKFNPLWNGQVAFMRKYISTFEILVTDRFENF